MVNIIIATVNRPPMLRQALRSVSAQTARARISRVLVSENGGNRDSRQCCAEFPELPIQYVFREPAITPPEHGRILLSDGLQDEFTAILHDDDWWVPTHLEYALKALEERKVATVYYSSVFEVTDEISLLKCEHNLCFWFGAGYPALTANWEINRAQVALATLLATPCRFSALVARSEALRKAYHNVAATKNPFDTDRMLALEMAKEGTVVYNPLPQVFIRTHALQDQWRFAPQKRIELTAKTTDWIIEEAGENPPELARRFVAAVKSCPPTARPLLDSFLFHPWCVPRMALNPQMESELRPLLPDEKSAQAGHKLKDAIRQFIPPIVLSAKRAVAQRLR
jgi:hypothetical protein